MRYSAITIVACIFAVSVASLPIAGDVPPTKDTDTCVAGVDGAVADSACYKKRGDVPSVAVEVPAEETDVCVAGVDGAVADSACYKKREEEEEAKRKRQQQCEKPNSASVEDSACY